MMAVHGPGGRPPRFDRQVLLAGLAVGLPAFVVLLLLLWLGDYSDKTRWTLTLLVGLAWVGLGFALQRRVVHPLYALANLLEALRIGDYSLRGRRGAGDDALAQVLREVNALRDHLREDRLGAREATALLERVVEEIEVAVFAFDAEGRLRLVNRAGERLLDRSAERLLGRSAAATGLAELLEGDAFRIVELAFPGAEGRWAVRRRTFRQDGRPHRLLVVADLSQTLREEERQAWRRLIRVLGHELNNSLAPIKSMAGTLSTLLARRPRAEDWEDDMRQGLDVICNRSESLSRFLAAYARLARLPPPTFAPTRVADLVRRVAALETRPASEQAAAIETESVEPETGGPETVQVVPGPELTVVADADQLEQLLINLVRNAVDAARETGGRVWVGWRYALDAVELWVRDEGPGLSNPDNLFVPFYTTKPSGTGIGLVLCRQIAEAHGGSLVLANHPEGGCEARLRLPFLAGGTPPGGRANSLVSTRPGTRPGTPGGSRGASRQAIY